MSTVRANNILDAAGGNTATINGMTPTGLSLQGFRNRLINSDMRIDQRNAGASVTPAANTYTLDRWLAVTAVASRYSVQRNAGAVTPPVGFSNYLGITSLAATAAGASDPYLLNHYIEGFNTADLAWGTSAAQAVTLSFWLRSSLTGTFSLSVCNGNSARNYIATYTVSAANTWEYKTITIPGDTSGTWFNDSGIGLQLRFDLGSGSNFNGTAGSWGTSNLLRTSGSQSIVGTNGATFYITGVQLEAGSVATPFERRDYGRELIMCQRYYMTSGTTVFGGGLQGFPRSTADSELNRWLVYKFPVTMRAVPTCTGIAVQEPSTSRTFNAESISQDWLNAFCNVDIATNVARFNSITASAEL